MVSTEPSVPKVGEAELAEQWVGRVIADRYRVVEVLGEGGMGAVFVAEHLKLRKLVAIKTIRAEFTDGQAEERFAREALATGQIDHPHVVSAIDYDHLPDGGAYLVIQLVRGQSLGKHLERSPLHWRQVAELGAQIADALATCHAVGIIHRDLKPDNILLERRDDGTFHARVVDFGIARVSGETGDGAVVDPTQAITRMGAIIGTPGYMAPEQAVGQAIDHRVDLYALGVILWESCVGQRLWQGETLTALFARQLAGACPSLRDALSGQVPDALSELTAQLLAPNPNHRPPVAAVVRDELRRIAFSGDAVVTSPGLDPRVSSPNHSIVSSQTLPTGVAPARTPGGTLIVPTVSLSPAQRLKIAAAGVAGKLRELAARDPRLVRYGAGALGLLLFVLLARCACGGGDEVPAPATPGAPASAAPKTKGREDAPGKRPDPKASEPKKDAPGTEPAEDPPASTDDVPAAFAEHAQTLLTSTKSKSRRKAALAITDAPEDVRQTIPKYLRNLAWMERNSSCESKRPILLNIEAEGDARALPSLKITAAKMKSECRSVFGFRSDECLDCMRDDINRIIGSFEAKAAP